MRKPEASPILNSELLTGYFRRTSFARSWREHGTSDWLLILTLDGAGRFIHADGSEAIARAGEATLIRPGTRHDYGPAKEVGIWETLWAHFYPRRHWAELVQWPEEVPGFMRVKIESSETFQRVRYRFAEADRMANESIPRRDWFAMNALEEVLLWCSLQAPQQNSQVDIRLQEMRRFIHSNLAEKLALEDLCEVCSLSKSRVTQLFSHHLGTTPMQYVEAQRIAKAKELLVRTSLSITEIAMVTGFESPFYFAIRFRKHSGLSPSGWRGERGVGW